MIGTYSAVLAFTVSSLLYFKFSHNELLYTSGWITSLDPVQTGRPANTADFESILKLTYNFQFKSADSLLAIARAKNPRSPEILLAAVNLGWWKIIAGDEDPGIRINFMSDLERARSLIQSRPDQSLSYEELFLLINTFAFKARIDLMEEHKVKGMFDVGECIRYIKKCLGQEPKYEPLLLTSGLYNFFSDYGLKNYPILYPTLLWLPKGNMETGKQQLETISRSGNAWLSTEGHYFLVKIYLELDKQPQKAAASAGWLIKRYPRNLIFQELLYRINIANEEPAIAGVILSQIREQASRNNQLSESQKAYFLSVHQRQTGK